jgi:tryptophan synthase alpha chain
VKAAIVSAREAGRCAFIPYVTYGYPDAASSLSIVERLESLGVAAVEIGIPFSDPVADGPTIQHTIEQALDGGMHLHQALEMLSESKPSGTSSRLLFSYYNPLLSFGIQDLPAAMLQASIGAALVTDIIPEESSEWRRCCDEGAIETCFLASITSSDERLALAAEASTGFVYCISSLGVTGARKAVDAAAEETVGRLRGFTDLPIAVGFGVARPGDAAQIAEYADGVIVGSALLSAIGDEPDGAADRAEAFVTPLMRACGY